MTPEEASAAIHIPTTPAQREAIRAEEERAAAQVVLAALDRELDTERIAGRRLPDCIVPCDPDCESGPAHCKWIHVPSHKPGWHDLASCPGKRGEES